MSQIPLCENIKTGKFIRELKNRFLCEVEIESEPVVCYVPSSCHLSNFLELNKKDVLLVPTANPSSRTKYALYAVPYKRNYIVLNPSMANRAIEACIHRRVFSYLGKREKVIREQYISGYKSDLFIEDTCTVIEVKSIISTETEASFPTVYSERTIKQLHAINSLLKNGIKACFCIVSLHPYVKTIVIDGSTEFFEELSKCKDAGLILKAYTSRLTNGGLQIEHQIPIEIR